LSKSEYGGLIAIGSSALFINFLVKKFMPSKVIDKVHHHVSKLVDEDNDMAGNNKFLKGFNKLAEASMDDDKKETDA
jgi:uncharacterized membrane protein